jgi:Probable Zinc-ribbon domain
VIARPKPKKKAPRSLAVDYPALAAQWHPTANAPLTPGDVTHGSHRRTVWICPSDPSHVWVAIVQSRTTQKRGCPWCGGVRVTPETSLVARYPKVAEEWHPTRNGGLRPCDVRYGSERRVWWQCPRHPRHVWQARVVDRSCGGVGCPSCPRRRTTSETSLAARFPQIAQEWHPNKNDWLSPADLLPGSNRKVWWRCRQDPSHEWRAVVASRTGLKTGCPACAGKVVTPKTSLAAKFPDVAKEWHPTRNRYLAPDVVMPHSARKVWWQCLRDATHAWRAQINSRTGQGTGCPVCANVVVTATNALAAWFPELAAEWHPSRNRPLRPERVLPGSNRKVWWRCHVKPAHVWCASVASRTSGSGCPACANKMVTEDNSLLAMLPELARQWHPTKNGSLTPASVTPGSGKSIWWRCPTNPAHAWCSPPFNRSRGSGCPHCYRAGWRPRSGRATKVAAQGSVRRPARRTHA